ncbi:MAG: ABC transporter ATP-binding protein [Rhizobiales bacterium]|nr:ABC transporter ATP-binding protein [Hyphomicrobiales bacterium]
MSELVLDRVTKIYKVKREPDVLAVDAVDMTVKDGEIVGLLGSSGCGKTSTLRMIAGFEDVTDGEIRANERRLNERPPAARNIAMAFEGYALYPPLKIRDNIAFGLLRDRRPRAEVDAKVREIAALLEIEDILERYPPTLSGGQQQRTSLARALARSADVHLLDEPMSQLEPQLRAVLRARIKDYLIQNRLTTIFVTHDQTEALALADRIAVMNDGRLQQYGTGDDLKDRPSNLYVASFIGEPPMNVFHTLARRGEAVHRLEIQTKDGDRAARLDLPRGGITDAVGSDLQNSRKLALGIRPHQVRLGAAPELGPVLKGRVTSNQWLGDQTHIGIETAGQLVIAVFDGTVSAPVDSTVEITLPLADLHLFDGASGVALHHGLTTAAAAA